MTRALALFLLFLGSATLTAQTHFDAGVALGTQSYSSTDEDPRYLPSAELVLWRGSFGVQLAVEYTDLPEGAMIATHPNLVYRRTFAESMFVLVGAGPTFVVPGTGNRTTWNAELELGRRFGRTSVFARVRQYDYELERFREGEAGPDSPAVYVGVRVGVR